MKYLGFSLFTILIITISKNLTANNPLDNSTLNNIKAQTAFSTLRGNGLAFTPNKGQIIDIQGKPRPDILYKGQGNGMDIYLRKGGISYVLSMYEEEEKLDTQLKTIKTHRIDMDFVGANLSSTNTHSKQLEGYQNFYRGYLTHSITNVQRYNQVVYENIYPNIDVQWYGDKTKGLKYDIIVNPGGDPANIKQQWKGANDLYLGEEGELIITTSLWELYEYIPRVYQEIDGKIVDIKGEYKLEEIQGNKNEYLVSLVLGAYNTGYPLIIDPWATYLGGNGDENATLLAIDGSNNLIIVGVTPSIDFPVLGAFQNTSGGGLDVFVSKLNSVGTLLWSTYFGGNANEGISSLAVDGNNNIIIAGTTNSTDFDTLSAFQNTFGGVADGFVSKFNSAGTLMWSTYFGGNANEGVASLAVDGNDNIIIAGTTNSTDFDTLNAFQDTLGGVQDVFVSKFSTSGILLWSTYLGGTGTDEKPFLIINGLDNIIVTGQTNSIDFDTLNAFQNTFAGGVDVFISNFNPVGILQWSTYLGGSGDELDPSLVVDGSGNFVLTGQTNSIDFDTLNAFQGTYGGGGFLADGDVFVSKFNSMGGLLWSTYLGGADFEEISGLVIDGMDNITVGGDTYSFTFPTTSCAYQTIFGGDEDNFVARFTPEGNIICSSYIGGTGHDEAHKYVGNIKIGGGMIYMSGYSDMAYPVTPGAFQTTFGGGFSDVFIAQFCPTTCGLFVLNMDFIADDTTVRCNNPISFTDSTPICDTTGVTWQWSFPSGIPSTSTDQNPRDILYDTPGDFDVKLKIITPCGSDSLIKSNYITIISDSNTTISPTDSYCLNDSTDTLKAINSGGVWTGTGMIDSVFSPTLAGVGTHQIIYTVCGDADTILINVNPLPEISLGVDTLICGVSIDLSVNTSNPDLSYLWSTGDSTPSITINTIGIYFVTATDSICNSSDSINVNSCSVIYIPNAFSPNGDGKNDIFRIRGSNIETLELSIYDRWGNRVYDTNDINKDPIAIGWDGSDSYRNDNGKPANKGVYVYMAKGNFVDGEKINLKGNVTLIR